MAPDAFRLTERRREIVRLVGEGHTRQQIGELLHVSPDTVRSHLRQMTKQLGARNAAHLVTIFYQRGWLTVPTQNGQAGQVRTIDQKFQDGLP